MLRRRGTKTSGGMEGNWTGAAEINYVEMSFARVPIFKECSRDELLRVARVTRIRENPAGDVIITEGAKGRDFFVILEGQANVTRGGVEVAKLEPGDFFGELALFDEAPRNATVTVVADAQAAFAVFDRASFQAALDEIPALRDSLLRGMARRLHELDAKA